GEQPPDSVLSRLGYNVHSLSIEGTVSTTGPQAMSGLPFEAAVVEDTMRMTMSGPFGITAAKIYAQPDTFVVVNYFMREVIDGDPEAPSLARAMPIPLTVSDLRMLVRGRLPGDLSRFVRGVQRSDESVLFTTMSEDGVEYALIDTTKSMLRQYQRKSKDGILVMNITFGDVRVVNGVEIPYSVDVAFDDKKQTIAFRFTNVVANEPVRAGLEVKIPPSFSRKTYR
ncbi:MAG: DUF4292 domain-containing protein, partial [Candidatus Kapabacteria bacterium]|nr:DUF4292 domain-containing protein [Candidatus Kapabacteria bacterium]